MCDNSYNFAFPHLREGTGVDPGEDEYAFARLLTSQMPKNISLESAPLPLQKQVPPTSLMTGTGVNEEAITGQNQLAKESAVKESEEELSQKEVQSIKEKIENVRASVSEGPLVVKSFEAGKRKKDIDNVNEALDEEGYGQKKKQAKHVVAHNFKFE